MMQGSDSFRLIVRRGPQPNQSYDLNKDIVTLGRDITNDIVINDPEVSRHHMRLTRGAGGFTVEDLGSTNGTFVNGQRLTGARPLRPGDMIGLGETVTLAYEMSAAPTIAEPQAEINPAGRSSVRRHSAPARSSIRQQPQQSPYQPVQPPTAAAAVALSARSAPTATATAVALRAAAVTLCPPSAAPPVPRRLRSRIRSLCRPRRRTAQHHALDSDWLRRLALFCCCATVLGLVFVDQACLWDRLPVIYDVLRALGYTAVVRKAQMKLLCCGSVVHNRGAVRRCMR